MNKSVWDKLHFCKDSCHILMLLPREKDWLYTWEKRTRARHYFVQSKEEREKKVDYMSKLQEEWEVGRIYSTYNARSLAKWVSNMLDRIAKGIAWNDYSFLTRGKWIIASCLKRKWTAYSRDYYMIDVDTKDERLLTYLLDVVRAWDKRKIDCFVDVYPTPNWYHVLIKPMDVRMFSWFDYAEVKTDEFIYIW